MTRHARWIAAAVVVGVLVAARLACAPEPTPVPRADLPVPKEPPRRVARPEAPPDVPTAKVDAPRVEPPTKRDMRIVVVADADGAPIEGAVVTMDETRRVVRKPDGSVDIDESIVRTVDAKSGADGAVVGALPSGDAEIVVRKSGFLVVRRPIEGDAPEVRVPLVAAIVVRGRVTFADTREPAPGVPVRAWDTGKMAGRTRDAVLDDVVTGADGRFELAGVPNGRQFRVTAAKPGFRSTDAVLTPTEAVPEIELVLGDGGVMFGVVYGPDGAPLADVDVFQVRPDMDELPRARDEGPFMTYARDDLVTFLFPPVRTDAAGRYEFRGVRLPVDGEPQPRVAAARLADGRTARGEPATFTRHGERQQRDIRFAKAGSITVTVKTTSPLPEGAELGCHGNGPSARGATRPAPTDGVPVVFDGLPANTYFVSLSTAGAGLGRGWSLTRHVKLADGGSATVEFALDGLPQIEGRVVDPEGRGIASIRVEFRAYAHADGVSADAETVSGADGAFSLRRLPAISGSVRAAPDEFGAFMARGERSPPPAVESAALDDVSPGGPPLTITLRRLGKLVGRVKPVPRNRHVGVTARAGGRYGSARFEMGADGRFECSAPLVGEASVAWFDFQTKPFTVVDLPAVASGETKDLGEIALETGVAFDGKLVDADGRGVASVRIHALESWAWFDDAATDAAGRFRLDGLPKRPLLIQAFATRATPMTVLRVDPNASPATFVVGPGAVVSGRVLDADGKPAAGASITVRPVGTADHAADAYDSTDADEDGTYAVRVQAGRAKLRAWSGRARTPSEWTELSVADGETRTLDLRLR